MNNRMEDNCMEDNCMEDNCMEDNCMDYNRMEDAAFEALLTAALEQSCAIEAAEAPPAEELAKKYPVSKRKLRYYIRKLKERNYRMPLALVYLRRAAIVVLVLVSATFATLISSEAVRDAIRTTVVEWYDKYISIDFKYSESGEQTEVTDSAEVSESGEQTAVTDAAEVTATAPDPIGSGDPSVGYIPEGFALTSSVDDSSSYREYIYMNDDGRYILVGIYSTASTAVGVDIEHSEYEELSVNGCDGYLTYQEDEATGSIVFGNADHTVSVSGTVAKDELVKIAQGIK